MLRLLCMLALFGWHPIQAADLRPMITIVEGEASVTDGAARSVATEGQRLSPGGLIDTGARTGLLRIEWPNGQRLDLGPDTRAMLGPVAAGSKPAAAYLLSGWAKLSGGSSQAFEGLLTPGLELPPHKGVAVVFMASNERVVFAETGAISLQERPGARQTLAAGQVYQRSGEAGASISPQPSADLLKRLPRGFRDTLPSRWARFANEAVKPAALSAPGYGELAPWLKAEPAIRRDFPKRFAARARETGFRAELIQNLAAHSEWQSVLYPPPPASAAVR